MKVIVFLLIIIIIGYKSIKAHELLLSSDYHNYEYVQNYLHAIAKQYSNIVTLYSIGQSYLGKDLWVALVTSSSKEDVGVPNVKIISTIHGNELITQEVILHFLQYLVTGYTSGDDNITNLLKTTKIHLLPNLNPDGAEECINWYRQNNITSECKYEPPGRRNYKGVDLDNNFDLGRKNDSASILKPEVEAIQKWIREYQFVTSLSLHSGRLLAYYPYDTYYHDAISVDDSVITPENEIFRHMALIYSLNHPSMHKGLPCPSSYKSFENGIVNGAALSPYKDSMQDYNYIVVRTMEITVSISCCKFPDSREIQSIYQSNEKSLYEWIALVHRGIKGRVVDSDTGVGVDYAIFEICNSSIYFGGSQSGEFWKILPSGHYVIGVTSKGYESCNFEFVIKDCEASALWFDINLRKCNGNCSSNDVCKDNNNSNNNNNLENRPSNITKMNLTTSSAHYYANNNLTENDTLRSMTDDIKIGESKLSSSSSDRVIYANFLISILAVYYLITLI